MPGLSRNQEKHIRSLSRKKGREQAGQFLVEGTKTVLEFIASGQEVVDVWATSDWISRHSVPKGIRVTEVDERELKKVSALSTAASVLAVVNMPQTPEVPQQVDDLVLLLDRINDPGNLGTLIRLADWFGLKQVWCSPQTVDVYNPKVVQATMGSLARIQVGYQDLDELIRIWRNEQPNLPVFGADMTGTPYAQAKMQTPAVLLLGSESHGIDPALRSLVSDFVVIPGSGGAESLNVALAGAILCAEFRRK